MNSVNYRGRSDFSDYTRSALNVVGAHAEAMRSTPGARAVVAATAETLLGSIIATKGVTSTVAQAARSSVETVSAGSEPVATNKVAPALTVVKEVTGPVRGAGASSVPNPKFTP